MNDDYTAELQIGVAPEAVFAALATLDGCSSWWAPASGSAAVGGELRFTFDDPGSPLILQVGAASPAEVVWHVTACAFLPDWAGSTISFQLTPAEDGTTGLRFLHAGLNPRLACFEECRAGWDFYLPSLRDHAESGAGRPFRTASSPAS